MSPTLAPPELTLGFKPPFLCLALAVTGSAVQEGQRMTDWTLGTASLP